MKKIQVITFSFILFFLMQFLHLNSYGAPMPGMGSSILSSKDLNLPFFIKNFKLRTELAGWQPILEPSENKGEVNLRLIQPMQKSSFTIKSETLPQSLSLENYSRKWIKEYVILGFEILGTKSFFQGQAKGVVVDLFHKKTEKQLRQVVFLKDRNSVILTCADHRESFSTTLQSCNKLIKTFEWLE